MAFLLLLKRLEIHYDQCFINQSRFGFFRIQCLEREIRWIYMIGFILIIMSFILISLRYGIKREYRFEVAAITIDYTVLIVSGILTGKLFKKREKNR